LTPREISESADDLPVEQQGFSSLGPQVRTAEVADPATGAPRTVRYIDDGPADGVPVVWFGGAGTTVRAFRLLEFARGLREQLRIRVIAVERNGLGETPYDPEAGYPEYAAGVWSVLDRLGVGQVSLMAISGGGPYCARVAAARPERVRSLHIACAWSDAAAEPAEADGGERRLPFDLQSIADDPVAWWRYPDDHPLMRIPGFGDSVVEEALLEAYAKGAPPDLSGLAQAFRLSRSEPLPELGGVTAPAFYYWGSDDPLVPVRHLERWREGLAKARPETVRLYEGEAHDVQYRHWDQVLADIAHLGERVVIALDAGGGPRTVLAEPERAARLLAAGEATPGLAAWR
jgi:pimeloyl-ACP methyl ester carboxylesterase